jgi:uncharacterized protein
MLGFPIWLIGAVALIFFLAGIVKGATGMGLPTVAMGLLGAMMPPAAAAALLVVPSFVTNVWQLFSGPAFLNLARRLWAMLLGILLATIAATSVLTSGHTAWITTALGAALMLYAAYTLLARQIRISAGRERWLSPIVGVTTGIVTGGTGVFVIPAVPYLQALGLATDDLIQALGLSFTISTIALAAGLAWRGAFETGNLALSAAALVPALLGMAAGTAIRRVVRPETFRRCFLVCLFLLGVDLAFRSWM